MRKVMDHTAVSATQASSQAAQLEIIKSHMHIEGLAAAQLQILFAWCQV